MQHTRAQLLAALGLSLVLTAGAILSSARAAESDAKHSGAQITAFSSADIHEPVVTRLRVTRAQAAALRAFVPAGTRAYFAGTPGDSDPDVVAWYDAPSGRLVAAVEIVTGAASPPGDGIRVSAGRSEQDKGAAIFAISTTAAVPALSEPSGPVQLRGPGSPAAHTAAALLAYEGSSNLVTLVSDANSALIDAQSIDVTVLNAAGTKAFAQSLRTSGGTYAQIATTPEGVEAPVTIVNTSDITTTVVTRAVPPLSRAPGADPDVRLVGPAQSVPGAPVRGPAGNWALAFDAVPTPNLDDAAEPLAPGPIVLSDEGLATITVRSSTGLAPSRGAGNIPAASLGNAPTSYNVSGSDSTASVVRIGAAGTVAIGAGALILRDRNGREQSRQFTVVPIRETMLDDGARLTSVTPIRSSGLLAANFPPEAAGGGDSRESSGDTTRPDEKAGGTTTTGDNSWTQPQECMCIAGGTVEITKVRTTGKDTTIEVTADVTVRVNVSTFGNEGTHSVTVAPGTTSAVFRVRGDVDTNKEWFTAVDLDGSTAWQIPGGGKSVTLTATCPPAATPPGTAFTGKLSGKGSWTEGSALDRVFRKEGGAGSATLTVRVDVAGCGGKKLIGKVDLAIYYDSARAAEKNLGNEPYAIGWLTEDVPPSIGADTSDPCKSKRAQLACFLACVGGKSADQIVEAAEATDMRSPEEFKTLIQRCCPDCERKNFYDNALKALMGAGRAMRGPGQQPQTPPQPRTPTGGP